MTRPSPAPKIARRQARQMAPWLIALGLCALLMVPAILRAPDDALENGHAARAGAGDADTGPR